MGYVVYRCMSVGASKLLRHVSFSNCAMMRLQQILSQSLLLPALRFPDFDRSNSLVSLCFCQIMKAFNRGT